ncbi:uncharacterized protein C8Q71DRAFT_326270 [Rhodofomes roseus]|uniref:Uncharacterized protein n=1 Tax=Rhodofomes roseus TaxID=34475 RepID=A0ABQ8KTE3_9APHY|nr:uncharacterized protein C8Q71DRAFT_326270 [Rhodofomes roseus]KAH9841361.1 hypothetical protein C8Q71DRAFT_326270 [Rhodofomes roseus]
MPQTHQFFHAGQPQYAPPVLRAPSPSSSIGTEYGPDETSLEDRDLSQEAFERKCEDRLRLRQPRPEEMRAMEDPLMRPRPKTATEEKVMFEIVMKKLRDRVKQLEEDELFEQMLLRGTQIGLEQPSSDDVDGIMRSLMVASVEAPPFANSFAPATPWSPTLAPIAGSTGGDTESGAATSGKRPTRKGKSRKA